MSFPKIEGYIVTEKLGSGSYSTVYKAYTKVGGRCVVAVKCVDKARVKHSGAAVDNLVSEIRLLKALEHPHIVRMHNFTWDDKNIYIVMEYCSGGDLAKYIRRRGRVPERQVLYFLQQLASALKYLREQDVAHMDLKPHNLLLHRNTDGKHVLKVADFGFALHLSDGSHRGVRGSPLYMAPEMLRGAGDARSDLWSVGVIMYECLFGAAPYSSTSMQDLVNKIQNKHPIQLPRGAGVSPGCQDLLARLLQHDPERRITYEQFFQHEYLDLQHMPTTENYDKAVFLMKRAVSLDAAGAERDALQCYTESLRYLVPFAAAETDAVRRSALSDKLTRYMDRAEVIKRRLCAHDDPPPPPPAAAPRVAGGEAPARDVTTLDDVTRLPDVTTLDDVTRVPADGSRTETPAAEVECAGGGGRGLRALRRLLAGAGAGATVSGAGPPAEPRDKDDNCRIT